MAGRKVFRNSIVPVAGAGHDGALGLVVNSASTGQLDEPFKVHFAFGLAPAVAAALEARIAAGQTVPPAELAAAVAAAPADVARLMDWLTANGYAIDHVAPDGIYASAPTATVASTLNVEMVRVTRDGFSHNAARTPPSLPADVGANVTAIGGLQPFLRAHRHSRKRALATPAAPAALAPAAAAPAAAAPDNVPPYFVGELLGAYDATGLGVTGAGQTIAILIDTVPTDSDIVAFWQRNGLGTALARIEKVNVRGTALPAPEGEETLDVAWSSGVAPGATIRVYASGSLAFVDLDRALDAIIADLPAHPGLRQLSISLGLGETFLGGAGGEVATQHQKYLQLAAAGVNVFVSTGDAGSNPDASGHGSGGPAQAEYPSSDPCVVAVGGTTLRLKSTGGVASETGWANGGGGKSRFFARAAWQKAKGVPSGSKRMVPDVSLAADPDTGAFLVLGAHDIQIGGTSWSAPVWAGFCALINEARTKAGKKPLPFLNPLLYPLAGTPRFRDIIGGSNGLFTAKAGFDLVTGLGVPSVKALSAALVAKP